MADVIFQEDQDTASRLPAAGSKPSMLISIVYKLGLAKTQRGAEYVLIATIITCVVLAVFFLFAGGVVSTSGSSATTLGPQATTPSNAVHVP
ncbi:MAG: hypothetical protein P4M11_00750 [Candidatus Pacebacteria bacterium]|nr:hypothetical protein [Candidatus Paceibacterota bacterium]